VVAVREVHHDDNTDRQHDPDLDNHSRPRRYVVALGTRPENFGASILAEGHDFYGAPRLDTATERLAVVAWDHPDMPWDRSILTVTALGIGVDPATGAPRLHAAGAAWCVEGGDDVSVGQPMWQRDGSLRFVSDRHGWWQPHTHNGAPDGGAAVALTEAAAEFHGPDWALGQSTMAELPDGTVVARMISEALDSVVLIDGAGSSPRPLPQPCVSISGLCGHGAAIAYIGAPPDGPANVWTLDPLGPAEPMPVATAWRPVPASGLDTRDVSRGEPFSFVGRHGRRVHGLMYTPTLRGTCGPAGALPPLVVGCHSGPTGSVGAGFDVAVQYFTSRGFAFAAVDYAGSTGYGRAYRTSLWGQWGVADAEDCVDAARHLAGEGRVDAGRMAVRGASSGGLTALNALAAGEGFAVAVSWYGVTDLLNLAATTHDFEAHYMERLVGPLPASRAIYEARSPVRRAAEIRGSVLLLQGLDDLVVPPAQTERLRDALLAEGRHAEVHFFTAEGHGFRRAETLAAGLEEELAFYRREMGL
jgi:dipeptidyl aminopeptidase/acylaminoacyl peptidase